MWDAVFTSGSIKIDNVVEKGPARDEASPQGREAVPERCLDTSIAGTSDALGVTVFQAERPSVGS